MANRILLDAGASAETIRSETIRMLAGPDAPDAYRQRAEASATRRPPERGDRWDVLLDGAGAPLQTLVSELEQRLGRASDAGDLLVVLASVPDGIGQRALAALGVDADALARAVDQARASRRRSTLLFAPELLAAIEQARAEKEQAVNANQFVQAAECRNRERELLEAALETVKPRQDQFALQLRARLGLDTA